MAKGIATRAVDLEPIGHRLICRVREVHRPAIEAIEQVRIGRGTRPHELVQVSSTRAQGPQLYGGTASPPDFVDWRRDNRSFSEMAAVSAGLR